MSDEIHRINGADLEGAKRSLLHVGKSLLNVEAEI